jgi:hypothetical protein
VLPERPRRIYWLDAPATDSATRRALTRAFDEAALYADDVRAASARPHPQRLPRLRLAASRRGHAPLSHPRSRT